MFFFSNNSETQNLNDLITLCFGASMGNLSFPLYSSFCNERFENRWLNIENIFSESFDMKNGLQISHLKELLRKYLLAYYNAFNA